MVISCVAMGLEGIEGKEMPAAASLVLVLYLPLPVRSFETYKQKESGEHSDN